MASNYQNIAATPLTASSYIGQARGLWARALDGLQTAVCGLHGHEMLMQSDRLSPPSSTIPCCSSSTGGCF